MIRTTSILALVSALLVSCAQHRARQQPREVFQRGEEWKHAPSWASASLRQDWWKSFRNSRLNSHLATALAHNPGLRVLGTRLERARAQTGQARAAAWPSINLGSGLVFGNEQTRMTRFSPTDLEPWASTGSVSWELDLFGRLHAGTRSAREAERAAFWDLHAGRLLVASKVADAHFRILRLNQERNLIADSIVANRKIVGVWRERRKAGLLSDTELLRHEAEHESLTRTLLDLDRLRGLAHLQLETLCGGSSLPRTSSHLSDVRIPALPTRTTSAVMTRRPDLLAAESRVRSAFQLEESARLHLLPSLTLGAGASGESASLLSGFREWTASVGPRLDIPIYDPRRLASVDVHRAATDEAAALYRRKALLAFQEVEGSYLNLASRHRQLQVAQREVTALEKARKNTLDTFENGIVSQIELLESERRSLEGKRQRLALRHALLRDHLALIRALGGGQDIPKSP